MKECIYLELNTPGRRPCLSEYMRDKEETTFLTLLIINFRGMMINAYIFITILIIINKYTIIIIVV